MTPGTSDCTDP